MKQIFLSLIFILLLASGCNNNRSIIKGSFSNKVSEDHEYIYLTKVEIGNYIISDSSVIKNNNFKFKVTIEEPTFYQIGFSENEFITILVAPKETVLVTFNSQTPSYNYSVTGSEGSTKVQELESKLRITKHQLDSLLTIYNTALQSNANEEQINTINKEYENVIEQQRRNNIQFILDNPKSYASILALYQQYDDNSYVLYSNRDLQFMKIVSDSLSAQYPNSKIIQSIANDLEQGKRQLYSSQIKQIIQSSPNTEPYIPNLLNEEGKRVSLSSLKGKYVLLSFYSYQIQDCLDDNQQLKSIYNKYHSKGFEIYHVNVDIDESLWHDYLTYENFPWINVHEELTDRMEAAEYYNIQTLPSNFLIDRQGNIIGSNLFGRNLAIKLEQIF